jgi:hypothetical protein
MSKTAGKKDLESIFWSQNNIYSPPFWKLYFSPSHDMTFFLLPSRPICLNSSLFFAFILPVYFPFSHFLSPFFLSLSLFYLFLLYFPPFSLRLFIFFPQITLAVNPPLCSWPFPSRKSHENFIKRWQFSWSGPARLPTILSDPYPQHLTSKLIQIRPVTGNCLELFNFLQLLNKTTPDVKIRRWQQQHQCTQWYNTGLWNLI